MDVEQLADPHSSTTFTFTSCGSIIPQPEQIKVTSKIDKPFMVNDENHEPCISIATCESALQMYLKEGGNNVLGELQDLVNEDGRLKSGHHAIRGYIQLLQSELELHGLDRRRSCMGDGGTVCVLLNPLLSTTQLLVLERFMRHKGLHVLYDMLRHFRLVVEARHVLCKLLKILQHLHGCNMLVVEHLQCDAPRFCMERFSKLLFDLCEHKDAEVRALGLRLSIPRWHASHAKCWAWGSAAPHAELHAAANYTSGCKIL